MFDKIDKLLIKEIQGDIPLTQDPYGDIAKRIGCSKDEILKRLENYSTRGIIKRIGAILNHRDSGYTENGMFTAVVPEEQIEIAGKKLTSLLNITHCYERKCYPEWPYNFYAMIHGKNKEEVEAIVNNFVNEMGIKDYQILYSIEEFKKTSMKYF
jgi:DNA-binding Lrp family transcriptional regulator